MENKISTAKEFRIKQNLLPDLALLRCTDGIALNCNERVEKLMIEFAKLHVKAALKEALESIPCLGSSTDIATYDEVEKEVLNAYPEELIK